MNPKDTLDFPPPAEAPAFIAAGVLLRDAVWKDEIWVAGDVLVPEGVALEIAPGTAIKFAQTALLRLKTEELDPGRWGLNPPDSLCGIFVRGSMLAEGERDKPITFGGSQAWSGLHAKGKGSVRLGHAVLAEGAAEALCAWDQATVTARHVSFIRNRVCLGVHGSGRAEMTDCRLDGTSSFGILSSGTSSMQAERCEISGGRIGLLAEGGRVQLQRCAFQGQGEAGIRLSGPGHRVEHTTVRAAPTGLAIANGRAELAGFNADCLDHGVLIEEGGELIWIGGGARGGTLAVALTGGQAELSGLELSGSAQGLHVRSGRLRAASIRLNDQRDAAAWVGPQGSLELLDADVQGARIGLLSDGGRVQLQRCAFQGQGEAGIRLSGPGHRVEHTAVRAAPTGLAIANGRAELAGFNADCLDHGVLIEEGGELVWIGGGARGGTLAVALTGGRAELSGLELSGSAQGLHVRSGRLRAASIRLNDQRDAAAWVGPQGSLELLDADVQGARIGLLSDGGRVQLQRCAFQGQGEAGIRLSGPGHRVEHTAVRAAPTGLALANGRAELAGFNADCLDHGVLIEEGGELVWIGGGARGGRVSLRLHGGEARLEDLVLQGASRHGIRIERGKAHASRLRVADCSRSGLFMARGSLDVEDSHLSNSPWGLLAIGGTVALSNCAFSGHMEAAIDIRGRGHRLERTSITSSAQEILLDSAPASLRGNSVEPTIKTTGPGPETKCESSRPIRRLLRYWVLRSSSIPCLRSFYRSIYRLAIRNFASWARRDENVSAAWLHRGWVGGDWEPGASDLDFILIARNLGETSGALWLRSFWRRWARWKRFFPFLGEILIAERSDLEDYLAWGGIRALELNARPDGLLEAVHTAAPEEPAVPRRAPRPPEEALSKPGNATKADALPIKAMTECAHAYTRIMQWTLNETNETWEVVRRQTGKAVVDLLRYGRTAANPEIFQDGTPNRREFRSELSNIGLGDWIPRLESLSASPKDPPHERRRLLAEIGTAALAYFHGLAPADETSGAPSFFREPREQASAGNAGGPGPCPRNVPPRLSYASPDPAPGAERLRLERLELIETLRRCFQDSLRGAVMDDLYRGYILLDDSAIGRDGLIGAWSRWIPAWKAQGTIRALPMPLSMSLWRLWQKIPYLDCPVRFLETPEGSTRDGLIYTAGAGLPAALFAWGEAPRPARVRDEELSLAARECLGNLRLSWRLLGCEDSGVSAEYALHYLYSRVLGLRLLLERGIGLPFFDLDGLLRAYRAEFPESGPWLDASFRKPVGKSASALFFQHHAFLDSQLRVRNGTDSGWEAR